ncbi:MAG: twin-arginine translocase subunit TatB [Pseudomonadota bacterium]|jgi:sec-independent protein translocase protein TatB
MFDIGFSELCMVGLVSLLVIGPERLPKVARMVGFWLGRIQAVSANIRAEIQYELQLEEMKQILQQPKSELHAVENDIEHLSDLAHTASYEATQWYSKSHSLTPELKTRDENSTELR